MSNDNDNKSGWESIQGSAATHGYYQPNADDIDCELRAEITFTRLYRNFSTVSETKNTFHVYSDYGALIPGQLHNDFA